MKPSQWPGWLQLEDDDVMMAGDAMIDAGIPGFTPETPYDTVYGYAGKKKREARGWLIFRRGVTGGRRIPPNPNFIKELNLP